MSSPPLDGSTLDLSRTGQIGPYRLLKRIGAGGMGEVFLGYDERLDRKVAIKRIRPGAETTPERRERFRREARLAARLSHSGIVQVYDILQEEGSEHIVMEYVEGTTLRDRIRQGPMEVREVLELAREVAAGLDAAHRQGIIHRDLKTENILISAAGGAKIMDFGIAKRLLAEEGEESLTADDAVIGTCRSMSPEQARGEDVDHRTDLFAFGVVLYEALTGTSPFATENRLATLNRVIHSRQRPVRELEPAVPEELSRLVDLLLEKEIFLRPQSAGQVRRELDRLALETADRRDIEALDLAATDGSEIPTLPEGPPAFAPPAALPPSPAGMRASPLRRRVAGLAALVILSGLGTGAYLALHPPEPPLYVAVLAPEIGAGTKGDEIDLLASGVRISLLQALTSLEGISPKGFDEIDAISGFPARVARAVSADEVVASRLDCRPATCRVSLRRLRGSDGSVLWADTLEVPSDDFALVASAVTRQLRRGYSDFDVRPGVSGPEMDSRDLKAFLDLRRRFDARQDIDFPTLLAEVSALRSRVPRFLEATLLEAEMARRRFSYSRDPQDLNRAFERVEEARALAPDDPRPLFFLVEVALGAGQLDRAEEALRRLEDLVPADARVQEKRAHLLKAKGRPEEALSLMRKVVRQQPSWKRLYNLALLESGEGLISDARSHLEAGLERAPGNPTILSKLAQVELINGDLSHAVRLYEELVQRAPGLAPLSNLGTAYLLAGRYREASEVFRRIVDSEAKNASFVLNLADSYLLMDRRELAMPLYRRAVELVEQDPNKSDPQGLTVKAQALAHLGQGPAAVSTVQQALRLAPDDAQVAFEASVVYAVLGEPASATSFAERALKQGYDRRWFELPYFASLKSWPDFRQVLEQPATRSR